MADIPQTKSLHDASPGFLDVTRINVESESLINHGSSAATGGYQNRKRPNEGSGHLPTTIKSPKLTTDYNTPLPSKWSSLVLVTVLILSMLSVYYLIFVMAGNTGNIDEGKYGDIKPGRSWQYHSAQDLGTGLGGTCVSLRDRHLYYPDADIAPSPAYLQRLRDYEAMHERCVGKVNLLPDYVSEPPKRRKSCKYLVWKTDTGGLGNRFLSILAAFEYALLTDRALLINTDGSIKNLICNPFPESSIWTPAEIPLDELLTAPFQNEFLNGKTCHEGAKDFNRTDLVTTYLRHDYNDFKDSNKFFCQAYQEKLQEARWMLWDSNQYIAPALYLVPSFRSNLNDWFPEHVTTTHAARYLLHPSNRVWAKIVKLHRAYFAHGGSKVGIQVRTFADFDREVVTRIATCLTMEKILPMPISEGRWNELSKDPEWLNAHKETKNGSSLISVFLASLDSGYYNELKDMYNDRPTEDGRIVAFYMESHEKHESHEAAADERAMIEMWFLSMADSLFVSSKSTFGYIANALHGSKSFYLNVRDGEWQRNEKGVCMSAWSTNACFHVKPFGLECPNETPHAFEDTNSWLPYVRQCQDGTVGLVVSPQH